MKKLFIASVLALGVSAALYSCNNGAYDAMPKVDLGSALNPMSPDSGSAKVYLGSMRATINNRTYTLAPAFYYIDTAGDYQFVARVMNDTFFERTLRFTFKKFDGRVDSFVVNADNATPIVTLTVRDTSRVDKAGRPIYNIYTANTGKGFGYSFIRFTGNEGGHMRGYYFGNLYHVLPEEKFSDTVVFKYSDFYFEKKAWPLPSGYRP